MRRDLYSLFLNFLVMSKKLITLALAGLMLLSIAGCNKGEDKETAGRPTLSTEQKQEIENTVKEADAAYDVNKVTGVYDTVDGGSTAWKMSLFAAGDAGALADTLYGVWANTSGGGILEGKVTKDGKFAGEWKTADGTFGKVVLVFKSDEDSTMSFTGTWGTGVNATNGGSWTGTETANSELAKDELAVLRAEYASLEEESEEAASDEETAEEEVVTEGEEATEENAETTETETEEETETEDSNI